MRRGGTKAARSPERIPKSAVCAGADETPDSRHSFIRWRYGGRRHGNAPSKSRIVERCAVIGSPQCSHLRSALAVARTSERALTMAPR